MARYFFHLHDRTTFVEDREGMELASLPEVTATALKGARSIISQDVLDGRMDLTGRIEVVDQDGRPVLTLTFREAAGLDA